MTHVSFPLLALDFIVPLQNYAVYFRADNRFANLLITRLISQQNIILLVN
jgi:hypothetical protein